MLDLVYEHPGIEKQESKIEFSDVACYHFKHTMSAIITDIEEVDPAAVVTEKAAMLSTFAREHGLAHWRGDAVQYAKELNTLSMRAWRLESAIGFSGFVVARNVMSTP
ncbi:MAG TPA: hypothetical protein VGD45_16125 [Steroidobacter sp.]|uniref:hypothetical protein n=1 Tax=Steroidobacter sp. TaxID=1978227 RepID=UPI002ED9FEA9